MGPHRLMLKNRPDNQSQQQGRIQVLEQPNNRIPLVKILGFRTDRRTVEDSLKIVPDWVGRDKQAQQANRASSQTNAGRAWKRPGEKEWD